MGWRPRRFQASNAKPDGSTALADSSSEDDDALPISGLQHLAFCPRQWALIHLEQVWVENVTDRRRAVAARARRPARREPSGKRAHGARHVAAVGEASLDRARRHRRVSSGAVSGGVQAGQKQADRLRYRAALRTGALSGGDARDGDSQRRDLLRQSTPAARGRLYPGASRTDRRTRSHDAPPVPQPGDAGGTARCLLSQLLFGSRVPSPGQCAARRRSALGGSGKCGRSNRRFRSTRHAKAAQYAARDDSRRLPAPRWRDHRHQGRAGTETARSRAHAGRLGVLGAGCMQPAAAWALLRAGRRHLLPH